MTEFKIIRKEVQNMLHIETEKVEFAKDIFKNRIVKGSFENPEYYSQKMYQFAVFEKTET